jgi:hypothetical protein
MRDDVPARIAVPAGRWHSACMRARTDDLAPADRKLFDDVEEYGVHIVHVPEDDEGEPGFSFTVGLWHSFQQPEVVVFGLAEDIAHELLNALADEAADAKKFLPDTRHEGLLIDYPVRFVGVPKPQYERYLGSAMWAYESDEFPCVQLVWPDKQGRWPWEPGVREGFAAAQPVLGRAAS